jgi:hypothetical protein
VAGAAGGVRPIRQNLVVRKRALKTSPEPLSYAFGATLGAVLRPVSILKREQNAKAAYI